MLKYMYVKENNILNSQPTINLLAPEFTFKF
jgi:hypothetical protein